MPRRDGTGPMGRGSKSGRGLGFCTGVNAVRHGAGQGLGLGRGRGLRRGFVADPIVSTTEKQLLQEQKELLESRLNIISKQLDRL